MYVVTYDITSDRLRAKAAKKLSDYGKRVQYSVFECHIDKDVFQEMYQELVELTLNHKEVNIRIYSIEKHLEQKILVIGDPSEVTFDEELDLLFI